MFCDVLHMLVIFWNVKFSKYTPIYIIKNFEDECHIPQ